MPRYKKFCFRNERHEIPDDDASGSGIKWTAAQQAEIDAMKLEWDALTWKVVRALEDHPEAKRAVLAVLDCGEGREAERKAAD